MFVIEVPEFINDYSPDLRQLLSNNPQFSAAIDYLMTMIDESLLWDIAQVLMDNDLAANADAWYSQMLVNEQAGKAIYCLDMTLDCAYDQAEDEDGPWLEFASDNYDVLSRYTLSRYKTLLTLYRNHLYSPCYNLRGEGSISTEYIDDWGYNTRVLHVCSWSY